MVIGFRVPPKVPRRKLIASCKHKEKTSTHNNKLAIRVGIAELRELGFVGDCFRLGFSNLGTLNPKP